MESRIDDLIGLWIQELRSDILTEESLPRKANWDTCHK